MMRTDEKTLSKLMFFDRKNNQERKIVKKTRIVRSNAIKLFQEFLT